MPSVAHQMCLGLSQLAQQQLHARVDVRGETLLGFGNLALHVGNSLLEGGQPSSPVVIPPPHAVRTLQHMYPLGGEGCVHPVCGGGAQVLIHTLQVRLQVYDEICPLLQRELGLHVLHLLIRVGDDGDQDVEEHDVDDNGKIVEEDEHPYALEVSFLVVLAKHEREGSKPCFYQASVGTVLIFREDVKGKGVREDDETDEREEGDHCNDDLLKDSDKHCEGRVASRYGSHPREHEHAANRPKDRRPLGTEEQHDGE
mmetsp:Transcript_34563/g.68826  ORF Transcript_34563/g.68826 Transcript_34563/m.68826 type:complete len:256 (-) Transcript_34563:567-1334(-)